MIGRMRLPRARSHRGGRRFPSNYLIEPERLRFRAGDRVRRLSDGKPGTVTRLQWGEPKAPIVRFDGETEEWQTQPNTLEIVERRLEEDERV